MSGPRVKENDINTGYAWGDPLIIDDDAFLSVFLFTIKRKLFFQAIFTVR